jgi:hypothetical protein
MSDQKFIYNFQISIGQAAIGGMPYGDAFIKFEINNQYVACSLNEFKSWIDGIVKSKGKRTNRGYDCKKKLDMFFNELIVPFMIFPNPNIKP